MAAAASHGSSRALPPVSVRKGIGCTVYYTIPYISLWRTVSERFPWIPRSIPSIDPCVTVAIQGKSHRGFAPPLQYWLLTPELQQQSRGQTAYLTGGTLWAAAVAAGAASPSGLRWPLQRASSGVGPSSLEPSVYTLPRKDPPGGATCHWNVASTAGGGTV